GQASRASTRSANGKSGRHISEPYANTQRSSVAWAGFGSMGGNIKERGVARRAGPAGSESTLKRRNAALERARRGRRHAAWQAQERHDVSVRVLRGRSAPPLAAVSAVRAGGAAGSGLDRSVVLCRRARGDRDRRMARARTAGRPGARLRLTVDRRLFVLPPNAFRRGPVLGYEAAQPPTPALPPS